MVLKYVPAGIMGFSLLASAVLGVDYLTAEYKTHLQKMETDSVYKAQIQAEIEQEKYELRQLDQELMKSWKDKHRIPGLEYVLRNL